MNMLEPPRICAIREFIEETHMFLKKISVLPETFNLTWEDPPNNRWEYKIHFAEGSLATDNLLTISESLDVDITSVNFNVKQCDFSINDEGSVVILPYSEYERLITEQMQLYHKSNYDLFLLRLRELIL